MSGLKFFGRLSGRRYIVFSVCFLMWRARRVAGFGLCFGAYGVLDYPGICDAGISGDVVHGDCNVTVGVVAFGDFTLPDEADRAFVLLRDEELLGDCGRHFVDEPEDALVLVFVPADEDASVDRIAALFLSAVCGHIR